MPETKDFQPSATVIADSVSPAGHRLTTMEVRIHRFVLAEFNTHRVFSRNSASSRAIPVAKVMEQLASEPAVPLSWPATKPGMQGGPELDKSTAAAARETWLNARDHAVEAAETLMRWRVHKSAINRLLEPFMSHTIIVSSTQWDGFWAQRCSPLAQPEIRAAATAMREAYNASLPIPVSDGEWHTPYVSAAELAEVGILVARQVSAARCARVSYLTHDGRHDSAADLALYDRLIRAEPPHASPLEHVATPWWPVVRPIGNFVGWVQQRHVEFGAD